MIVKLNTYEGVPIGGNNFDDFLNYVRGFLGANFGFSTNVLDNQGGYFSDDDFVYNTEDGVSGTEAVFFGPSTKDFGNFFGRKDNEFFRFEVLKTDPEPQVYRWVSLLTSSSASESNRLLFENIDENTTRALPYRPVTFDDVQEAYRYGYRDVRINGIPQDLVSDSTYLYTFSPPSFSSQEFSLNLMSLGAEHPTPSLGGRYDDSFLSPEEGVTRSEFISDYDSTLVFEYTNFSLDFGAHVLLWRQGLGEVNRFAYVPQDLTSSEDVAPGTFKVLNFSRGEIKLNITNSQLQSLLFEGETVGDLSTEVNFIVVSAEQLKEEFIGGIGHYYTRYGEVYNGDTFSTVLAEYVFDGTQNLVREIPSSDYFSGVGDLLLQDTNRRYDDGVILGIRYKGLPNTENLRKVQNNRYKPDTLQFYYHSGIVKNSSVPNSSIRSMVEINPSSWYNRDVIDSEYFPVNRTNESFYTFLLSSEAPLFSDVFDPNLDFKIVDTIGLQDLNDVVTPGTNQALIFNGTNFVGIDYTISALLDTNIVGASSNQLLQYVGSEWTNRSLTQVMTSGEISDVVSYTSAVSSGLGSPTVGNNVLATKGYVVSHMNDTSPHQSTSNATENRLVLRDSSGRSRVSNSSVVYNTGSPTGNFSSIDSPGVGQEIVNVNWLLNVAAPNDVYNTDSSLVSGGANRIPRRDNDGYLYARTPSTASIQNSAGRRRNTVVTKEYVDNAISGATISFNPILDNTNVQYRGGTSNTLAVNLTYTSNSALTIRDNNFHHLYDNVGIYTFTINAGSALASFFTVRLTPRYRLTSIMAFQGTVVNNGFPGAGNSTGYLNNNVATSHVIYGGYVDGTISPNNTARNLFIGCRKGSSEHVRYSIQIIGRFA